jgi:hypothetical protein
MENVTKKCNKCHTVKELVGGFYKDKYNKKDGYMNTCKECDNQYQKTWREKQKALATITQVAPVVEEAVI